MDSPFEPVATVHIVDDDDSVRESMQFLLEAEGLTVRSYPNAQALLDTDLPVLGCVLTDFRMPGIDGLQLANVVEVQLDFTSLLSGRTCTR